MIATCPACGKRYRIADDAVPAGGRSVRCAACGHGWTALPEASDTPPAPIVSDTPAEIPLNATVAESPTAAAPASAPVTTAEPATDRPRRRRYPGWIAAIVALLAVAALAVVEFAPEDTFDPPRLGLPAAHMPVADLGSLALPSLPQLPPLDLTRVPLVGDALDRLVNPPPTPASPLRITAAGERRRLANGSWLLTITGSVANPTAAPVALTAIDASLGDASGHVALRWRIAAPATIVGARSQVPFDSTAANFPPQATILKLRPR